MLKIAGVDTIDEAEALPRARAAHRRGGARSRCPRAPTTTTSSAACASRTPPGEPLGGSRTSWRRAATRRCWWCGGGGRDADPPGGRLRAGRGPRARARWSSRRCRESRCDAAGLTSSRSSRAWSQAPLADGIVRRAVDARPGAPRASTTCATSPTTATARVDDAPFGGGPGHGDEGRAVLPRGGVAAARRARARDAVVLLSPRGRALRPGGGRPLFAASIAWSCSAGATRGSTSGCARALATEEVSLGDFVLTGGEVAALAVIEATVRLLPGRPRRRGLGGGRLLRRRPAGLPALHAARGRAAACAVPEVLLSGDHGRGPPLAAQGGAPGHARAAARPAASRPAWRPRTRPCCARSSDEEHRLPAGVASEP